ncbi:TetR/AcrR family transcriptional regulator [Leptospira venezuelensis]|uniref:TetR/AcrR family transcriptional regulator n=1 Tax=Leptospira venezuelensis TaxID=1958811 RepID=UPI000A379C1D|nr:TetR/AcrR family transcriptional regulator [Leptospira venezuelensis]
MKKWTSPEETKGRIVQEALNLFYTQGYSNTGINQLLEEAGVFRKSFYTHFSGKEELGLEYLHAQDRSYIGYMRTMMEKYPDAQDFIHAWCAMILRNSRTKKFIGCPFSNFASQTLDQTEYFGKNLNEIMNNWKNELANYFSKASFKGKPLRSKDTQDLAIRFLTCYEGLVQLYITMRESKYLSRLEKDLEKILEEYY